MYVGFDEQIFLAQSRGGISRYVANLFRELSALGEDVTPVAGWRYSPNLHARGLHLSRALAGLPVDGPLAAVGRPAYFVANSAARRKLRACDVLHYTYYHPQFMRPKFGGLRVSTIHDMIPELYPELFTRRDPHLAKSRYLAASDLLICNSEATRRDLIAVYGDRGVATVVTHLGVEPRFRPGLPPVAGLSEQYILYVGQRGGYKDFAVLVEALAGLDARGHALVAVGGGRFSDDELRLQRRLGVERRVVRVDAGDVELARLYANAAVFVFPSRHEGFGLPTLEAMASATAVVLADTSSHPEVGGPVARYFRPGDPDSLRAVLDELLGDDDQRAERGRLGVHRAAQFTWAATARATAQAYRSALAGG